MLHKRRRWRLIPVASAEELAAKLTGGAWCLCSAFELQGYWFLNDAISEDSAQEYAVVKRRGPHGGPLQVESITMSWCSYGEALDYIRRAVAGQFDASPRARPVRPRMERPEQHEGCPLCG